MQHLTVRIADYQPHPSNYNEHSAAQLEELKASLLRFDQYKNIVTWRGFWLAGHGLVEAAQLLGWEEIVVVDVSHLDEADALALLAADNETARQAKADAVKLAALVQEVTASGRSVPGIGEKELQRILSAAGDQLLDEAEADPLEGLIPDEDRYREQYGVIVMCQDAAHQEAIYNELRELGHECRVVVT